MRARMALLVSGVRVEIREVALRDKPAEMREASEKATTPTMVLPDGAVLDESLDIMHWALDHHDPAAWRAVDIDGQQALIQENDGPFKHHLDRYKYATRYPGEDAAIHRGQGRAFLDLLATRLADNPHLMGQAPAMADIAIFPFVRQFRIADPTWFDETMPAHLRHWLTAHMESALFTRTMEKLALWSPDDAPVFLDRDDYTRTGLEA